ncbi:hypothetical protein ACHQM5_024275 [Ranunculus cassubicifolius]
MAFFSAFISKLFCSSQNSPEERAVNNTSKLNRTKTSKLIKSHTPKCTSPIVVSYFPVGSSLSQL